MLNKQSLALVACFAFAPTFIACGAASPSSNDDVEDVVSAEDELQDGVSLRGKYEPTAAGDDTEFDELAVSASGKKLSITLSGLNEKRVYGLSRTSSGAYVFTSGELDGECDNPGCNTLQKIAGVVYVKKVGKKQIASAKVTVTRRYFYPESPGDLEGDFAETYRFTKR